MPICPKDKLAGAYKHGFMHCKSNRHSTRQDKVHLYHRTEPDLIPSCLKPELFILSHLGPKVIQARHNRIPSTVQRSTAADGKLSPKSSVHLSLRVDNSFSFSFLQAGVGRRAALATGSCEFFIEWRCLMGRHSGPPNIPTHSPPQNDT